jgi:hypothetical protein
MIEIKSVQDLQFHMGNDSQERYQISIFEEMQLFSYLIL